MNNSQATPPPTVDVERDLCNQFNTRLFDVINASHVYDRCALLLAAVEIEANLAEKTQQIAADVNTHLDHVNQQILGVLNEMF